MAVEKFSAVDLVEGRENWQSFDSPFLDSGPLTSGPAQKIAELNFGDRRSADELLLKSTRAVCKRYRIEFTYLLAIQRKFVTHFRCSQCGLLPLYEINLAHVKRVRCGKCGQLVNFKGTGKYGRLRKAIAFELAKENQENGNCSS